MEVLDLSTVPMRFNYLRSRFYELVEIVSAHRKRPRSE